MATILEKKSLKSNDFNVDSYITESQLYKSLDNSEFKDDLLKLYKIDLEKPQVIKIGNAKQLIAAISDLDSECEKIDIDSKIKDVQLKTLLEDEKALFEIFSIIDKKILLKGKSDPLIVESRYNAKTDILDYYNLSKFANYCRDLDYGDLINTIKIYLKEKNSENDELRKLRLIYKKKDEKFYFRAITSIEDYKDFGINFSAFVALVSLNKYVESTTNEIFIDTFVVDDSTYAPDELRLV